MKEAIERLAETHDKLGDSIQLAILALWRFYADNPGWRSRAVVIHSNLDKALELFCQCSKDLETISRGVEEV